MLNPRGNPAPAPPDPVVERVREHDGAAGRQVIVVGPGEAPQELWPQVKHFVAYRVHRNSEAGGPPTDAAIHLVRTSDLYSKAAAALRTGTTHEDYVWCLLAAVLAHETAHTHPDTERQALAAEAMQLRRCQAAGHLSPTDKLKVASYVARVEARLRKDRSHH